jgi:hypothetical protein
MVEKKKDASTATTIFSVKPSRARALNTCTVLYAYVPVPNVQQGNARVPALFLVPENACWSHGVAIWVLSGLFIALD